MKRSHFLILAFTFIASLSAMTYADGTALKVIVIHGNSKDAGRSSLNNRQMLILQGKVITVSKGLDSASVDSSVKNGFKTTLSEGLDWLDLDCADGIYFLSTSADSSAPEVASFTCVNK